MGPPAEAAGWGHAASKGGGERGGVGGGGCLGTICRLPVLQELDHPRQASPSANDVWPGVQVVQEGNEGWDERETAELQGVEARSPHKATPSGKLVGYRRGHCRGQGGGGGVAVMQGLGPEQPQQGNSPWSKVVGPSVGLLPGRRRGGGGGGSSGRQRTG